MMLSLLDSDPTLYLISVFVVIASVCLHELGHAYTADWQGDPTPRMLGHMTWDPRKHMGWLAIGLACVIGVAFGRTPVNTRLFRNRRWGDVMVSFAGPAVNLLLGVVAAVCLAGLVSGHEAEGGLVAGRSTGAIAKDIGYLAQFWWWCCLLNFALFVFNMIPLPPFDGFSVAGGFVDFGSFGEMLKRAYPWPMIAAFAAVYYGPFWQWIFVVIEFQVALYRSIF